MLIDSQRADWIVYTKATIESAKAAGLRSMAIPFDRVDELK